MLAGFDEYGDAWAGTAKLNPGTLSGQSCLIQLLRRQLQVALADDIIAFKHRPRLVAGHLHGNSLWNTGADQVAYSSSTEVVGYSSRQSSFPTGSVPGTLEGFDLSAVTMACDASCHHLFRNFWEGSAEPRRGCSRRPDPPDNDPDIQIFCNKLPESLPQHPGQRMNGSHRCSRPSPTSRHARCRYPSVIPRDNCAVPGRRQCRMVPIWYPEDMS